MNYIYTRASAASADWAEELYDELVKLTGLKGDRAAPIQKANLYETKYTDAPAVLMELGFMDSRTDVPVILTEQYATNCAQACVNVIVKRAKLKKKATSTTTTTKPAVKPSTTTLLKRGSEGEKVERLQNLLNLLGYDCGDSDGDFGGNTEKAVIAFQKAYKLGADGVYGPASHAAMKTALTSSKIVLTKSSVMSTKVKALQEIISDFGYDCGTQDGIYGSKTADGVKDFQRSRGLSPDGVCGPKTIAKFVEYLAL
jgi:peptidoglycan hydrolase-like protein with peptidoglycan-binding domain